MFAKLPSHIRIQVVALLAKNDFRSAKALYDVWARQMKVQHHAYSEITA